MRSQRPRPLLPLLCALALLGCEGNTQGYYGPCDEPLGLAAGCPAEAGEEEFTPVDACMKLATCGIIHTSEDPPEGTAPEDYETEFERCIQEVRAASGEDPGALVLTCIQESTCNDLSETDAGENPMPDPEPVERVLGWCGRFDP